jgi:hypothetical protein
MAGAFKKMGGKTRMQLGIFRLIFGIAEPHQSGLAESG